MSHRETQLQPFIICVIVNKHSFNRLECLSSENIYTQAQYILERGNVITVNEATSF
jgi:hypothetical protein